MNRDGHDNAIFFIGPEVEHTPAYSKKTLFVVGKQDLKKIIDLAQTHKVPHIFMGANHSFEADVEDNTHYWDLTIQALLDRGFWVTIDYPAHQHKLVLKMLGVGVWKSRFFVPLLRVCIPHVQTSNLNLTVKIDDIDFKASNPGVWCMHFHEVTDSNRFTDWIEYGNDWIIPNDEPEAVPTPAQEYVATLATEAKVASEVKNEVNLGLDPDSASKLKGEPERIIEKLDITALDTAEAYAGKESSKKAKK